MKAALVAVLLVVPLLPSAAPEPSEVMPEGCTRETARLVTCAWEATFAPGSLEEFTAPIPRFDLVVFDLTVATPAETAFDAGLRNESRTVVSRFQQVPESTSPRVAALLDLDPTVAHEVFLKRSVQSFGFPVPDVPVPGSGESYEIRLALEDAVGSVHATGRAGSPSDPQLHDRAGDATEPGYDIVGAWFDDPILDDGLIEVGVVMPELTRIPSPPQRNLRQPLVSVVWTLLGHGSEVDWNLEPDGTWSAHIHYQFTHGGAGANALMDEMSSARGPRAELIARADPPNGTLTALLPVRLLGNPADGDRFSGLVARSRRAITFGIEGQFDEATEEVRPFALGGPAVWAGLRGESLAPASLAPAPWYADPFAGENLPDTLQVLGAAGAAALFVAGAFAVRGRGARLRAYLEEIDDAAAIPDRARALQALDALDAKFDALLTKGRLGEGQHAALENRIARAGYRLARGGGEP